MRQRFMPGGRLLVAATVTVALGALAPGAEGQWVQQHEQFYLPAAHNWVFRQNYAAADRLFNAFDYGHAVLYEELYNRPDAPVERLEEKEYNFLTRKLLKRPPRVPLEEGAIEVAYAKLAPEAKMMFEWAHLLHRQIYDVLADERLTQGEKDAEVAELLAYYKTRPEIAFSSVPKSMELMDGQFYSLGFRERYPKFNGLIWAYHWLQVGLYEPLMVYPDVASRSKGVNATLGRFWQMLENAPQTMPYLMPMTAGVAPTFAARYPEAAIIFDNLHMMHDVVSDILVSPEVPRGAKRREILRAAELFRDRTSFAIPVEEWRMMGEVMGVNNMGGPAVGFLAALPEPSVPRGMSMAGMQHGAMAGMQHGAMAGMEGMQPAGMGMGGERHKMTAEMQHGAAVRPSEGAVPPMQGMDHAVAERRMNASAVTAMPGMRGAPLSTDAALMQRMQEFQARMMDDPVIRERVATDPVLQRMMREMPDMMPPPGHVMPMQGRMNMGAVPTSAADQEQAMEFIVRLLADPLVEAQIHSDAQLHKLWSDPEVQARLQALRAARQDTAGPQRQHQH